mgnify:CR=1 FL=1
MSRSLKKGPFADQSLLKKVDALNAANDKSVIKNLVTPVPQSSRLLLDIQSLSMTEENMCRYILLRIWLVTNLVSLLLPEPTEDTEKDEKEIRCSLVSTFHQAA